MIPCDAVMVIVIGVITFTTASGTPYSSVKYGTSTYWIPNSGIRDSVAFEAL